MATWFRIRDVLQVRRVAFTCRAKQDSYIQEVLVGDTISLRENVSYVIEFTEPLQASTLSEMEQIGYVQITPTTGLLRFKNFLGVARLKGTKIQVESSKISAYGVSKLLEQVSELSSNLIFGFRSPTNLQVVSTQSHRPSIPYHQLQYLREVILRRPIGERLQDYLGAIERNPTRRFVSERPVIGVERSRRLDGRSILDMITHVERLSPLQSDSFLHANPLALALEWGTPPRRHFPRSVSEAARKLSFDTTENRFVKHFINEALAVTYRFLENPVIHPQMKNDCREITTILEACSRARHIAESSALTSLSSPTQALAKNEGYKEVLTMWREFSACVSLPSLNKDVQRLLEGRDIATLYEYWAFLKVVQAVTKSIGYDNSTQIKVTTDALGERIENGLSIAFTDKISVVFNLTCSRSKRTAYSTPLRPDVVLSVGTRNFAFDAKYRLRWLLVDEKNGDPEGVYVRETIHKMHAYRDAIIGVQAAFAIYPGTEFAFFERIGKMCASPSEITVLDGVGAIPLKPDSDDPATTLNEVVNRLVMPTSS